jgi:transposase
VAVDGLGNPVRFILTGGERNDITQAEPLIRGLPARYVLADKAYDADHFRQAIHAKGAEPVIPVNRTRARYDDHDRHLYKERNLVERFFNKIKHFRRIATRYEQTARAYLSMVQLVAVVIWTR